MSTKHFQLKITGGIALAALFAGCDHYPSATDPFVDTPSPRMARMNPAAGPHGPSHCGPADSLSEPGMQPCSGENSLFVEEWDVFDESIWKGDGDQTVADGAFLSRFSSGSAAADFISPQPFDIPAGGMIRFGNLLEFATDANNHFKASGGLFMVNADGDGDFKNYAFVNVGYTSNSAMVFVEIFGSDNGRDFDQLQEIAVSELNGPQVQVDLQVRAGGYRVEIDGVAIDSVALTDTLTSLGLFEVCVMGAKVHSTSITGICPRVVESRPRHHPRFRHGRDMPQFVRRHPGRNAFIRMAREKIKTEKHPSLGMRCLAKMKEKRD